MSNRTSKQTSNGTPLERKLYDHPVFDHYSKVHETHISKNLLCAKIEDPVQTELTSNSLKGDKKIILRSQTLFVISDKFLEQFKDIRRLLDHDKNQSYTFFHLGDMVSGHPKIVHGGLIATILDELTCGLGIQNFKSRKAVTANLNIDYRKPCFTNEYVMAKCLLVEKSGRKCIIMGQIYHLDLDPGVFDPEVESEKHLISECLAVIVEPKFEI